ncbi:MAG: DNA mismatch endonuclease Vsr [Betaproteobacteria bacterium]|nr:DNA mismatch endonuclease Vsr [Betaproteobacteria bacterium]
MDIVSPEVRRRMMAGIRGKDTRPELVVRSIVHRLGLRFRLHRKELPGRPDLVLSRHRTVIFVHGCFWHRHDCGLAAVPKTRPEFWAGKFAANVQRDQRNRLALEGLGWRVIEVWECEVRDPQSLAKRLRELFEL